jgi:hypothetical protein
MNTDVDELNGLLNLRKTKIQIWLCLSTSRQDKHRESQNVICHSCIFLGS